SAGNKTITGLTVENKAVAQAITATAAAGVKRIDVDVTAASPLNVAVSLLQNGQIRNTCAIAAGVGRVSFEISRRAHIPSPSITRRLRRAYPRR
ncbi:MAG: hypothetical protein ACLUN5_16070, partial [Oscillospiraceae bacterium]